MRKISFVVLLLAVSSGVASAQFLGQMTPASTLPVATGKLGGYVVLHENATAVVGSLRYGFSDDFEGRFRLGLIDYDVPDSDIQVVLGTDVKYRLWKYQQNNNPFDFSVGANMEYAGADPGNVFGLGGFVVGSVPVVLSNNTTLEPYGRLGLRYQRVSFGDQRDLDGRKIDAESDLKASLSVGALFAATKYVDFTAELMIDDDDVAFLLGVDFAAF